MEFDSTCAKILNSFVLLLLLACSNEVFCQESKKDGIVKTLTEDKKNVIIESQKGTVPQVGTKGYVYEKIEDEKVANLAVVKVYNSSKEKTEGKIIEKDKDTELVGQPVMFSKTKPLLRVVAEPRDVTVQIIGAKYRESTEGPITVAVDSGTYQVRVSRAGYETQLKTVQLQPGARKKVNISLVPGPSLQKKVGGAAVLLHPSGLSIDMVQLSGGRYRRGNWNNSGYDDQTPVRAIMLDGFAISQKEITVGQFRTFVKETGYTTSAEKYGGCWKTNSEGKLAKEERATWRNPGFQQEEDHPVVCVSWTDAREFADWIDARLPTEAEWEYAARSGGQKIRYPWGNVFTGDTLNFADRNTSFPWSEASTDDGYRQTAPVGSYSQNEVGLYDMGGNVAEWCQDWYQPDYYSMSSKQNPDGPSQGEKRVYRGGSWRDHATDSQTTVRRKAKPNLPTGYLGFRVVWDRD